MEAPSSTYTQTEIVLPSTSNTPPILRLRLEKKKSPKRVAFSSGTVDNENMNKKKSKCCCIYKKPLAFGESSSSSEEECEHCFGHPEKRKKKCNQPSSALTKNTENEDKNTNTETEQYNLDTCAPKERDVDNFKNIAE